MKKLIAFGFAVALSVAAFAQNTTPSAFASPKVSYSIGFWSEHYRIGDAAVEKTDIDAALKKFAPASEMWREGQGQQITGTALGVMSAGLFCAALFTKGATATSFWIVGGLVDISALIVDSGASKKKKMAIALYNTHNGYTD